jgi:hypothetical protein
VALAPEQDQVQVGQSILGEQALKTTVIARSTDWWCSEPTRAVLQELPRRQWLELPQVSKLPGTS